MYIIRADGNAKIGAGHLMRCLTVAEALAKMLDDTGVREQNICFFCADEQSAGMAESYGFQAKVLMTDYRDMESELPIWGELLASEELSTKELYTEELSVKELPLEKLSSEEHSTKHVILVDSYYVTDKYLKQLRRYGKVYLMDDMQERAYPVDTVINYNAFAKDEIYRQLYQDTETKCYVGSAYVPVRQQFLNRDYNLSETVKNVLITTGGGDQDNIAGAILKTIYCEGIDFHVVTGRYNPHIDTLKKLENNCLGVHIHYDVADMAGLMQKCDIAVTAGGTTIYELASIGVPFICFSYAKNQEALTEYIGENGIAGFLGAYHKNKETVLEKLKELFVQYCEQYDLRKMCYRKEREMIDGQGAVRLAKKMV